MDNPLSYQVLNLPDDLLESLPELATDCEYLLVVDGTAGVSEATRAILFRHQPSYSAVSAYGGWSRDSCKKVPFTLADMNLVGSE
jgi:hypothetical protein